MLNLYLMFNYLYHGIFQQTVMERCTVSNLTDRTPRLDPTKSSFPHQDATPTFQIPLDPLVSGGHDHSSRPGRAIQPHCNSFTWAPG